MCIVLFHVISAAIMFLFTDPDYCAKRNTLPYRTAQKTTDENKNNVSSLVNTIFVDNELDKEIKVTVLM